MRIAFIGHGNVGAPLADTRVRVNAVSRGWITETLRAMGMDPGPGLPAARAAEAYVRQIESGASGSVVVAARQ